MKRLVLAVALLASTAAFAHGPHGYWRHGGDGRWFWLAPVVVSGAVAYEVSRPPVVQQPVIIQQNQVINDSNCSPWTQIQNPDGTVTSTRTCR
jgi:hypothetical protein